MVVVAAMFPLIPGGARRRHSLFRMNKSKASHNGNVDTKTSYTLCMYFISDTISNR